MCKRKEDIIKGLISGMRKRPIHQLYIFHRGISTRKSMSYNVIRNVRKNASRDEEMFFGNTCVTPVKIVEIVRLLSSRRKLTCCCARFETSSWTVINHGMLPAFRRFPSTRQTNKEKKEKKKKKKKNCKRTRRRNSQRTRLETFSSCLGHARVMYLIDWFPALCSKPG